MLTAAALDAYVHDVLVAASSTAERRGLLGTLARKWVNRDALLASLPAGTQRRRRIRELIAQRLERATIMKAAAVEEHLRDVLGAGPPWPEAATAMTSLEDPMNEAAVRARLDAFVSRRHRIAHRGDRTPRGGLNHIGADYVEDQLFLMTKLAGAVEVTVRARLR
ncbi:MAG: hypothetical protein HYY42_01055 [Chloroflexi bacterium]|nr:hypothetical protein [Chloroflexota bacterium]MBI2982774.1 hypothetical protein [Chloroflexota bacterium]